MPQKERGGLVFRQLTNRYDKLRARGSKQHFFVRDVRVCRCVFLLAYPISPSTLGVVVKRVADGHASMYDKEEGFMADSTTTITLEAAAWLLVWSEINGETYVGQYNRLNTSHTDLTVLHKQYCDERWAEGCDAIAYSTFVKVWTTHPLLDHVHMRKNGKLNFHSCETCEALRMGIKKAVATGTPADVKRAKLALQVHYTQQRMEREIYYYRRYCSRKDGAESLCLIFDKWSCWTTVVPYFARPPCGDWQKWRDQMLKLHVLLVQARLSY
jgi:hypothetical protein